MTEVVKKHQCSFRKTFYYLVSQTKNNSENPLLLPSQILSTIHKIRTSKNRADVKVIKKTIITIRGTSFDEGYIEVNISQLVDKKIITDVKTPQDLDFFRLFITEITSEDNLPLQVEEIVLDNTEQCQQNTYFIRNLLNDTINNALDNLEKSSDETLTVHIG